MDTTKEPLPGPYQCRHPETNSSTAEERHRPAGMLSCSTTKIVESLKGSESIGGPEVKDAAGEISTIDDDAKNNEVSVITADKIVKELMRIKKQNTVTHWLLSIMIVVTAAWQISEVSLILKMKDNLRHPLRSVGNLVSGFFRGKDPAAEGDVEKDKLSSTTERDKNSVLPAIPSINIPGLPMIDFTNFPSKDDDSD